MSLKKRPVVKFRDMSSTIANRCHATSNGSGVQVNEVDSDFTEDDDDDKQERGHSGAEHDVQLEDCDCNDNNNDNNDMTDVISSLADVFSVEDTVNLLNPSLLDILADSDMV